MKKLYLDCGMGAAGDMLTAALLELHPDPDGFVERLNGIGIPGVEIRRNTLTRCGIRGAGMSVLVNGVEEDEIHEHGHDHEHEHEHEHEHHHHHRHTGMDEINKIIDGLKVSDKVKSDIRAVYGLIAAAESEAHGRPVEEIHFHEVGSMDAVADIAAVSMLMEELAPDRVEASPVHVGSGMVRCAHGILPVPAPATAHILRGVPTYGGEVRGELCTPTGAALLRHFADEFAASSAISAEKIGYGFGKRQFFASDGTEILSAVRAMLGEDGARDEVVILSCNIDDMTGEELGFAAERLMAAGARDVFTAPVYMKKGRPGSLLTVICDSGTKNVLVRQIFRHTATVGIREQTARRYILDRTVEVRRTPDGDVRVKKSTGYGVRREKPEFEDLKRIALEKDKSIGEIDV